MAEEVKNETPVETPKPQKFKWKDMQGWQKKRLGFSLFLFFLIAISFLTYTCSALYADKTGESKYWESYFESNPKVEARAATYNANATQVSVGTYIENIKELNLKTNSFRGVYLVWFKWNGNEELDMANNFRVYKGLINKTETVKESHVGDEHYQLLRIDVTISKQFWTPRFPLESHQLRMYIESNYPVDDVMFVADKENSGYNPSLSLTGYEFEKVATESVLNEYDSNHGDPAIDNAVITSEHMTQMEINRSDFGTYFRCFIALLGTTVWVFITLYINTNHRVDPLGMIPAALFGTVTNIMVGANLLPDSLQTGLLEYVNFWGIFTILAVTFSVININRIRAKFEDRLFANYYGKWMFYSILITVLLGHILLPLSSYIF